MLSPALLNGLLTITKGTDTSPVSGASLLEWGGTGEVDELIRSGILHESESAEEIQCREQCECDDGVLKVKYDSNNEASIYCPIGQVASKRVDRNTLRRFAFSRTDFLIWLSRNNGWELSDHFSSAIVTNTYYFAALQQSKRRISICFAGESDNPDFVNRMSRLRIHAKPETPFVILCADNPCLTLDEKVQLNQRSIYISCLSYCLDTSTGKIILPIDQHVPHDEQSIPALILQRISTGVKRGFVAELAGRLIPNQSIPLGRSKLLLLHTMMHAAISINSTQTYFEITEQELTGKFATWHQRKWVTANAKRANNYNMCVAQQWEKLTTRLKECNLDKYFQRSRENGIVFYRILLPRDEISCLITDLEHAVEQTGNSGYRSKK